MSEGRVDDIYTRIKARVVGFAIRPGERLNEVALARDLGVSRTPLREALNRLVAERLVEVRPGTGFSCRDLEPKAIYDLYEARRILETSAAMLACDRAPDDDLAAFGEETIRTGLAAAGLTVAQATDRDEAFHLGIARLSGNGELVRQLASINERIRFVRWVRMAGRDAATRAEHKKILSALLDRDADRAGDLMSAHVSRRLDQVTAAVKEGISSIYMDGAEALAARPVGDGAA